MNKNQEDEYKKDIPNIERLCQEIKFIVDCSNLSTPSRLIALIRACYEQTLTDLGHNGIHILKDFFDSL